MKKKRTKSNILKTSKKIRGSKVKNITVEILTDFLDIVEDLADLSFSRNAAYQMFNQNKNYDWPKTKIGRWLEGLKYSGYLEIKPEKNGEKTIIFTNKGKLKVIDKIAQKNICDGKKRFVSFDIPEDERTKRDQFRRSIKNIGFMQIQKSLWVINKNVADLIELACKEFGVEKYVVYIVSEKSDIDEYIEQKFE